MALLSQGSCRILHSPVPWYRTEGPGFPSFTNTLLKGAVLLAFHLVCKLPNCQAACLGGFYNPSLFMPVTDEFLLCCSAHYLFGEKKNLHLQLKYLGGLLSSAGGKERGRGEDERQEVNWAVFSPRKPLPIRRTPVSVIWMIKKRERTAEFGEDEFPEL